MKRFLIAALFVQSFFQSTISYAEPAQILFEITPDTAWIRLTETQQSLESGQFLEEGDYQIQISQQYYLDELMTVTLDEDQATQLNIEMHLDVENIMSKIRTRRSLVSWVRDLAAQGNGEANLILARLYYDGTILSKNLSSALKHYQAGANANNLTSLHTLATWYEQGIYVKTDWSKAVDLLERAARLDDADAQFRLGEFYLSKLKGGQNFEQALKWFKRAAWLGHNDSLAMLVNMYNEGEGIEEDDEERIFWYEKLAESGDSTAISIIVNYYEVENNPGKVFLWRKKLAKTGDLEAMVAIAVAYRDGVGVALDKRNAKDWLTKAAKNGSKKAKDMLQALTPAAPVKKPKKVAQVNLPKMIRIPAGAFIMGSDDHGVHASPSHEVNVATFEISETEVTWDQFSEFVEETDFIIPKDNGWGRGNRPVINITWGQAVAYSRWLSERVGKKYRLPTEAEWEYAARAGTQGSFYWGNSSIRFKANCVRSLCDDKYSFTAPVKAFDANPWGLYDTVGNVWEWTLDCWNGNFQAAPTNGKAWLEGDCNSKVIKGASWMNTSTDVFLAARRSQPYNRSTAGIGFRVVREIK
jgi:formylglycine-generating enzyme required for sulfatase activity